MAQFSTKDAIVLAYSNPDFMRKLIANPEEFAEEFDLDPKEIAVLRTMDPDRVESMGASVTNPIEFARTAGTVGRLASSAAAYK